MTMVWLHGAGLNGASWGPRAEGLTPDLPGHGAAPRVAPATVERFAEALITQMPARFALVGHSLGGMVALEIAARLGDRVRVLVLAETVGCATASTGQVVASHVARAAFPLMGVGMIAKLSEWTEKTEAAKALSRRISETSRDGIMDALTAALAYDGRPQLRQIRVPTLVLHGRRNPKTASGAKALAQGIPDAQLVTLEAGHLLQADAPDAFFGAIQNFERAHT